MKVAVLGPLVKDTIIIGETKSEQIGGIVYYVSKALAHLEVDVTAYANYDEKDDAWVRENLKGIKIVRLPSDGTLKFTNTYKDNDANIRYTKITFFQNTIKPDHVENKLDGYDYIILGPLLHENTSKELFGSLSHKKIILGNFGIFSSIENGELVHKHPEKLLSILKHIEYLFLDENEIKFVSGKETVEKSIKFLMKKGAKNIIVTKGSEGSILFIGEKIYDIPAFPSKVLVDPTGAGDTYLAGFIKSMELFNDPKEQGKFAAMVATMSIEKKGAFDNSLKKVYERLCWI